MGALAILAALFSSCILPPNTDILQVHSPQYHDSKIKTKMSEYGSAEIILKPEKDCLLQQQRKVKA